jgi:DUF1009 family protein
MAHEARARSWRVVAFTFDGAPDMDGVADRVVPSRLGDLAAVLAACQAEAVRAIVLSGRFSMRAFLQGSADEVDGMAGEYLRRARSREAAAVFDSIVRLLTSLGIDVLDQRAFLGATLPAAGVLSARGPTEGERRDVERGLRLARAVAGAGIGQTLVLRDGVVTAVEAVEGTTEAIGRGAALAGPGAVVVKAVAADHDYRFDLPAIGLDTLEAAVAGRAAAVAVEAGRVAILDLDAVVRAADAAGIALVSADGAE